MTVITQIIGIIAMAFNILSFQGKRQKDIIALQLIGSVLFTVHFFMLKAYTGGLMNAIGIIRAIVFLKKDFFKSDNVWWLIGFETVYALSYMLTFTVFGKEATPINFLIEIFPIIGSTATTLAFRSKTAKSTRLLGLISSPSWLIYNIIVVSVGAICCEAISLISIIVALFRFDSKAKKENKTETNDENV